MMRRMLATLMLSVAVTAWPCLGDEPEKGENDLAGLSAYQAVREGNQRLVQGNPGGALDAYQHAEALEPEAREIAFVEGLAHFDRKEYDQAREAFRKAAELANDRLADDALYSLGTCDHAEALEKMDQPQLALSLLENAMGRYQEVLAREPEHKAARQGNFKAASMWRELKRQLEQQPPQPSESCDNPQEQDGDKKEEEKKEQSPQSQDQEQQEQEQQEHPSDQQQQEQQQQQQEEKEQEQSASSQQSEEQQEKQEQQSAQASEEEQQQQQAQQAEAEQQQEQVSREQAERQLREMMQSVRDRRAMRRVPVQKVPVTPVDKDW